MGALISHKECWGLTCQPRSCQF